MLTSELRALAEARPVQAEYKDGAIEGGYTSDLLSDVMAHAKTGDVLVTIQAHKNTVAVAGLVGAPAIILCNDRPIPDDMIQAAKEEGIALFSTSLSQFEVSGRLWKALKA
ncbi:MAG: hypothetical protein RBT72_05640 [Spirochaetia bacterium]|jgi:hypothetical protein|nr:hypothetical protein [Spirochaetales bacterium]MDX9784219.1 hypothetical protein [Spirochaetia bacterium]